MKPIVIAVAGGSASGKSSVIRDIQKSLDTDDFVIIKHDDYYKDQSHMSIEERRLTNYDHPSSLETDLMYKQIKQLINGKAIDKPTYDFVHHTRSDIVEHIEPKKVIMLDGILVLEDPRIRELADIKVYVECDEDLRLIRRIKRDMVERGREFDEIVNQYLTTVKPMHHSFVRPTKRYADIIIPNDFSHSVGVDLLVEKIKSIVKK